MSKALILGNGRMLINIDDAGQVRDLYFPHVGLENHVGGRYVHRVGVYADGQLAWTGDAGWALKVEAAPDTLSGVVVAEHAGLGLRLIIENSIYNEKNIFLRRVKLINLRAESRAVKVFFGHQFEPYESHTAHTAYYDPEAQAVIHYRNQRAFLVAADTEGRRFTEYTTGVFGMEGKEGSHVDAADGVLSGNPIEHGQADSVIGVSLECPAGESKGVVYWLIAGQSVSEVKAIERQFRDVGVSHAFETTSNYWQAWVRRHRFSFHGLEQPLVDLFNHSLLVMRAHADDAGGIIASGDSNALQKGKDTYTYVWPRDGALTALALARAGDVSVARRFFGFACDVLGEGEYMLHKYSPDKSLGSSWHPWIKDGRSQLPIQEDETALVLHALWQYYEVSKDLEFVEDIYNRVIKRMADFMVVYRDAKTGLPRPSYDLWEENYGVHTYTAAAVYGGLVAASNFAKVLGKIKTAQIYLATAAEIKEGIMNHLFDPSRGVFYKMARFAADELAYDAAIDAAATYGVFSFGVLTPWDERLGTAFRRTEEALSGRMPSGGVARYQGDNYYRACHDCPGNPWFITTLWLAQYKIPLAKTEADLAAVKDTLHWVAKRATASRLLAEQLHPHTGEPLSVTPLVWSHAEYVNTVIQYLDKLETLGVCVACNPVY